MPPKKTVPGEAAARIIRAMQGIKDAYAERDASIADALKGDASIREVAAASGMSTTSVQKIGRANGWPSPAQLRAREAEQAEKDRFNEYLQAYRAQQPDA